MNKASLLLSIDELGTKRMLCGKLLDKCKALQMGSIRALFVLCIGVKKD